MLFVNGPKAKWRLVYLLRRFLSPSKYFIIHSKTANLSDPCFKHKVPNAVAGRETVIAKTRRFRDYHQPTHALQLPTRTYDFLSRVSERKLGGIRLETSGTGDVAFSNRCVVELVEKRGMPFYLVPLQIIALRHLFSLFCAYDVSLRTVVEPLEQ